MDFFTASLSIKLSFMADKIQVEGSAKYLKETQVCQRTPNAQHVILLQVDIKTSRVDLTYDASTRVESIPNSLR
jgi:hypothetical protein